jgi:hypothetical protein
LLSPNDVATNNQEECKENKIDGKKLNLVFKKYNIYKSGLLKDVNISINQINLNKDQTALNLSIFKGF